MNTLYIPGPNIEEAGETLMQHIGDASSTDQQMKENFRIIHYIATEALSSIPGMKESGAIVTWEIFEKKVQCLGEGVFCDQLRALISSKDWHSFLSSGMNILSLHSIMITTVLIYQFLFLDLFFNRLSSKGTSPFGFSI